MSGAKLFDSNTGRQYVDRYELVGEIASGGMATVYLARLTGVGGFQRFVAIKRLHAHLAGDDEFVQMFLNEARIAARIHHPHVVPILEVGSSAGGYYLVMEYVEGDTLARLLARALARGMRLPASVGVRIGLDMLTGLHAAHELRDDAGLPLGLVHRDVSPQNVLVGVDGVVRITDFGVARARSRLSDTRGGQLKGKIAYMAPEQAAGDDDIDRRADVFSCAIVLWEALTGRRLFKSDSDASTLSRIMRSPITPPSQLAGGVSRELSDVLMRGLDRDRNRRFATCAEFAMALERAAGGPESIATAREVTAYVNDVIGGEIAKQREAVRAWVALSDSGQGSAPSFGGMAVSRSEHSQSASPIAVSVIQPRSRAPLFAGVGLLVGLAFAVAFFISRSFVHTEPLQIAEPLAPALPRLAPTASPVRAASQAPAAEAAALPVPVVSPEALPKEVRPAPQWVAPVRPRPAAAPAAPARPPSSATSAAPASAAPAAAPAPAPPSKSDDDVDLRNPYR